MPQYTENYSYAEPQYGEQADIAVLNQYVTRKVDENMYQTRRMMVDGFDDTKSYTTGDLVEYSNAIYRFIADKASGAWDSTKVELTTIADELATKGEGGADVTKTASGNPIEITDGADAPLVKCVTAIQGNQDLHGYDKPWVGGAGKNKYNATKERETADGITIVKNEIGEYIITGRATALHQFALGNNTIPAGSYILSGCPSGGGQSSYDIRFTNDFIDNGNGVNFTLNESTTASIYITVRNGYQFPTDGIVFKPMIRLASVADSTFAPYSNICPITAYNQSTISVGGKNLAPSSPINRGQYVDGNFQNNNNRICSDYINILPNIEYTASIDSSNMENLAFINYAYFDKNKTYLGDRATNGESAFSGDKVHTFSISNSQVAYIRLTIRAYSSPDLNISDKTLDDAQFMLEVGSLATTYEPYVNTDHTATFSNSIYQGNADFVGRSATADLIAIDLGDLPWVYNATDAYFAAELPEMKDYNYDITPSWKCSIYEIGPTRYSTNAGSSANYTIFPRTSSKYVFVKDTRYTSASDLITALSGEKLVIDVENPITETITPTNLPIKSLFGYNHIESSTGDMEVEYITEEFQPLVDLIESNSGKVTQDILYTASTMSETEIDVDLTAYDEYIIFANDVLVTTQIPQGSTFPRITFDVAITNNSSIVIYGYDDCSCIYTVSSNKLTYNSGRGGYRITMIIGVKVGDVSTSQTLNRSLRSLNLTKSAVDEIPEEIKNAEYEEKPDVNEAEDDAPTEEKR